MPIVKTQRGKTRLTSLQIADRFLERSTASIQFLDIQPFTLAAQTAGANTSTLATFPVKNCALGDVFLVSPTTAMPAGLTIDGAYVTVASVGSPSPQTNETPGTVTVQFSNATAGGLAMAGTYQYIQFSQTAGAI
jgi:hypothetical protein